jgi:septum formation protein
MAHSLPTRLTLASSSPARRDLLTEAGYSFDILPANIDEPKGEDASDIRAFVQQVAWLKAAAVAPRVAGGIVLAADTVAWIDGSVIGKPADEADARRILTRLGGREHELWTGVCLWRRPDDFQLAWQEVTRVWFRRLEAAELDAYLATRRWANNSGAYAIEGPDDPYVRVVQGSMSNVIGLPMESLEMWLPALARLPGA